jgi:hypothetical protein
VSFISINTRDPDGQVDAEVKKYKVDYPVFYGRGQNINSDFKVLKLPRLLLVRGDSSVVQDALFLKADELRAEIDGLLAGAAADSGIGR